jgi:hypothetical protein
LGGQEILLSITAFRTALRIDNWTIWRMATAIRQIVHPSYAAGPPRAFPVLVVFRDTAAMKAVAPLR